MPFFYLIASSNDFVHCWLCLARVTNSACTWTSFLCPVVMAIVPADLAQNPPAGRPPPGVLPNYVNPPSKGPIFYYVGSILLFIMIVIFSTRMYVKFRIVKKRTWDDCESTSQANGNGADSSVCSNLFHCRSESKESRFNRTTNAQVGLRDRSERLFISWPSFYAS